MQEIHSQTPDGEIARSGRSPTQTDTGGRVTHDYLRRILKYEPKTGEWIRKEAISNYKAGEKAGCIDSDGYRRIWIGGRPYFGQVLAWFYQKKQWPPRRALCYRNGVAGDDRWENLTLRARQGAFDFA